MFVEWLEEYEKPNFRAISRLIKMYGRFTNLQFRAVPEQPEPQFKNS
jgi:hypothetical protein